MDLEDVTLDVYFGLPDASAYVAILKHLKPRNEFAGSKVNLERLTYKEIRICTKLVRSGSTVQHLEVLFCTMFNVIPHRFYKARVSEYFAAQNYLLKTLHGLEQREAKLLKSIEDIDTALWEMAGAERLQKFGNLAPLMQLGEIYGLWPFELEKRPYNEILTLLIAHKEKAEVTKEFQRLKAKQKR
jgi:hypothetical protein